MSENLNKFPTDITLDFEDGSSIDCEVISTFDMDGQFYVALNPVEDACELTTEDILFFRATPCEDDEDDINLEEIEDDEEFENVYDAFYALHEETFLDDAEDEE